jgi:predicted AlkP superfamily phosphohydrolase/phosphomutase
MAWNSLLVRKSASLDKKAVIIGLDGVPYSLLKDYIKQGMMPHLADMNGLGNLLPMNSTLPEVSSVAWSSFMTGQNPAQHGIFGFMEIDRNTYEYQFPNFLALKTSPLWEVLNLPTVAFNIPQTYPAKPMNGILVSGFVSVDLEKAVYPRRIYDYLRQIDYKLDVKSHLAARDPEAFFDDLFLTFEKRMEAIKYLYDHEDWRLFIGTITETDRLHHFFFDSARGGKYHEVFQRFYQKLDTFLWEMFTRSQQDEALFLTCSDHGFSVIETEVYVNRYLIEQGFLAISGNDGLLGITPESRAFCLEPARVYLHLQGNYARGAVAISEYAAIREEIRDLFYSLSYQGRKIVNKVYFKEDIFSGPYMDQAPDLYVLPHPGFDLKSSLNKDSVFGHSHFTGAHTYEDAHLYISGRQLPDTPKDLSIENLSKLVSSFLIPEKE